MAMQECGKLDLWSGDPCPECDAELTWGLDHQGRMTLLVCPNPKCHVGGVCHDDPDSEERR